MGVKGLMRFLNTECRKDEVGSGVGTISIRDLRGKTVVIDASIYMYRFKQDGRLHELFYHMVSILVSHKIKPIFVFDGKPPESKMDTIETRREGRRDAKLEYDVMKQRVDALHDQLVAARAEASPDTILCADHEKRLRRMRWKLETVRRESVTLTHQNFVSIKHLLDTMGIYHITPPYEADPLCVKFVNSGVAYACMTEDTDMFVYGCHRVIRSLDLYDQTVVLYTTDAILKRLGVSHRMFRTMCFLSGTDYSTTRYGSTMDSVYRSYKSMSESVFELTANDWLDGEGCGYNEMVSEYDYSHCTTDDYYARRKSLRYCEADTRDIMRTHGFIYV
jgi:flap endonuclease-1